MNIKLRGVEFSIETLVYGLQVLYEFKIMFVPLLYYICNTIYRNLK